MISIYVHRNGETTSVPHIDPAWLEPSTDVTLWVDLAAPGPNEGRLLSDVFRFHPLSVEDALSAIHHPKIEPYPGYLYVILHGIDFEGRRKGFATRDIDFFLGRNYLVTVHDGRSRSIARWREVCDRHEHVLAEGPAALLHRIVDTMVENYRPEVDALEDQIDELEETAILGRRPNLIRQILVLKRDLASLRRVVLPQRDAVGRLARREFPQINDEIAYRFRDVYDHFVRLSDEAILFQDRVTSILEAHLSAVSNRLNVIVKVLTVISTIFLPLTVLTGMWGMNIPLPTFPGGEGAQFWWVAAVMAAIAVGMLAVFRWNRWI
ncbi:MAG: magnesium/cobalt transporter CorA [Acidobacteria bacterium]|nr:magnesium/cobalt transporter CorA [Acidobacteriota bacterium]